MWMILFLGGLAALAPQPSTQTRPSGSPCALADQWGAEAAVGEFCAGEAAQRLASATEAGPERLRQLARAADHYRRAAAVATRSEAQVLAFALLADCYDPQHLNDPTRQEAALRDLLRLVPGDIAPVARLGRLQEE